ncbi:MAG: FAD-dependent monooxygenase, partial [Acidobacteria bacterium]|nr:FAD-dependent monooxygenase [Acidobacteriota bacterium]
MAQNGERVDVLIIGGSLAGAAAAFPLARQGVRVRILEKARFPRPKICGEFLSPESFPVLARMGVLDSLRESGAETIERFEAYSPSGSSVSGELPAPVLSISRDVLDHRVLRAAEGAGAAVAFGETVMSFSGSLSRGFEVQTSKRLHHSRLLLGAWGRFSPLDPRIR